MEILASLVAKDGGKQTSPVFVAAFYAKIELAAVPSPIIAFF